MRKKFIKKQPPRKQYTPRAPSHLPGDKDNPATFLFNNASHSANDNHRKNGQYYIGSHGDIRRHIKGGRDKLILAPKDYPTQKKKYLADTRKKHEKYQRLSALIAMRETIDKILDLQTRFDDDAIAHLPESPWAEHQTKLKKLYDNFYNTYGPINKFEIKSTGRFDDNGESIDYKFYPNLKKFRKDPDAYLVASIEEIDHVTGEVTLGPIFTERVVQARKSHHNITTLEDAIAVCLDHKAALDLDYLCALGPVNDREKLERALIKDNLAYFDPAAQSWQTPDEYLSGNVRNKLKEVENAVQDHVSGMRRNIQALKAVIPEDLGYEDIDIALGEGWIPPEIVKDFAEEILGIEIKTPDYIPEYHHWDIEYIDLLDEQKSRSYETEFTDVQQLLKHALNGSLVTISRQTDRQNQKIDPVLETQVARTKQKSINKAFKDWVWQDKKRTAQLCQIYNEHFRSVVPRRYDGSHLHFAGMSEAIRLRPHQNNAIWRNISSGNTLYEHDVGSGKTFTSIASAMKMMEMGLAHKPLLTVPGTMVGEFARAFRKLFPRSHVLVIEPDSLLDDDKKLPLTEKMENVKELIRHHNGPIIMSHDNYDRFDVSPETRLQELIDEARHLTTLIKNNKIRQSYIPRKLTIALEKIAIFLEKEEELFTLKTAEADSAADRQENTEEKENFLAQFSRILHEDATAPSWQTYLMAKNGDKSINFEETGIDYVFGDEEHGYKNLPVSSRHQGLSNSGSAKTLSFSRKIAFLEKQKPGFCHTSMTWTPVSNSLAESHTMLQYLAPQMLKETGLEHIDAFAATFCDMEEKLEIAPEGGFRMKERIAHYKNLPELVRMYIQVSDIVSEDMLDLNKPELKGGKEETIIVPSYPELRKFLDVELKIRASKARDPFSDKREDNLLKIMNEAIMATLHPGMVMLDVAPGTVTKIDIIADEVAQRYHNHKDKVFYNEQGKQDPLTGALQAVICDLGVPRPGQDFSVYQDLKNKLVARGVPKSKIAFVQDYGTAEKEQEFQRKCNQGECAVVIGTTAKLGTGKNIQKRLIALHQALMLWRPSDDDQSKGRIDRQGNQNKEVEILRYVVENSPDAYRWQTLARKSRPINQLKRQDLETREHVADAQTLNYDEVVAAILNSDLVFDLSRTEHELTELERLKTAYTQKQLRARALKKQRQDDVKNIQAQQKELTPFIEAINALPQDQSPLSIEGAPFSSDKEAGAHIKEKLRDLRDQLRTQEKPVTIDNYGTLFGYPLHLSATVDIDEKSSDGKTDKSYKYGFNFTVQLSKTETIDIALSTNDIRQIQAERDLKKAGIAATETENDQEETTLSNEFDAATAQQDIDQINAALIQKLCAPFIQKQEEYQGLQTLMDGLHTAIAEMDDIIKTPCQNSAKIGGLKRKKSHLEKQLMAQKEEQEANLNTPPPSKANHQAGPPPSPG